MAIGRLVAKAAKAATKKKGTLKENRSHTKYTRDKKTGKVRSVSKKTEERYNKMAEQKVKSDAKKAGKAAAAGASVVAAGAAAQKVANERKKNDEMSKRVEERKSSPKKRTTPAKTTGKSLKERQRDAKNIAEGAKAVKAKKAKADTKRATASRVTSDMSGAPKTKSYKIKKGDTLSALAKKYGTSVKTIMNLNEGIKDADKIYAGRTIKLPSEK